mgnify:FL=1
MSSRLALLLLVLTSTSHCAARLTIGFEDLLLRERLSVKNLTGITTQGIQWNHSGPLSLLEKSPQLTPTLPSSPALVTLSSTHPHLTSPSNQMLSNQPAVLSPFNEVLGDPPASGGSESLQSQCSTQACEEVDDLFEEVLFRHVDQGDNHPYVTAYSSSSKTIGQIRSEIMGGRERWWIEKFWEVTCRTDIPMSGMGAHWHIKVDINGDWTEAEGIQKMKDDHSNCP